MRGRSLNGLNSFVTLHGTINDLVRYGGMGVYIIYIVYGVCSVLGLYTSNGSDLHIKADTASSVVAQREITKDDSFKTVL